MGNGAILTNKSMGARIDEYNVIARSVLKGTSPPGFLNNIF
jgi:hypothetical protein